jgi:replicative DNA helicase
MQKIAEKPRRSLPPGATADRPAPSNAEAEKAILGTCLRDPKKVHEAIRFLRPTDFYLFQNQKLFEAMLEISAAGKYVDKATVYRWIVQNKHESDVSAEYISQLIIYGGTAEIEAYAEIVREFAIRRDLINVAGEINAEGWNPQAPIDEVLEGVQQKIFDVADRGVASEPVELHVALRDSFERIEARKSGNLSAGIMTGFADLDNVLSGFRDSEMVLLAARPSVGKTSLATGFALAAAKAGLPTLFVSLEQSRSELTDRILCMESRVDSHRLHRNYLGSDEYTQMLDASERLNRLPLFIDDKPGQKILQIGATARRAKIKRGIRFLLIDYLQLVEPDNPRATQQEQVSVISRKVKLIARDLKIPVLACAQLNRQSEERAGGRPKLSDLRSSGQLEQDADAVLLLHRPDPNASLVEIIVAKNRNGPTGDVNLIYQKQYMRFESCAYGEVG